MHLTCFKCDIPYVLIQLWYE